MKPLVRAIYNVSEQTFFIELHSGERTCYTPEECKALEEALYEARASIPYKLMKKPEEKIN